MWWSNLLCGKTLVDHTLNAFLLLEKFLYSKKVVFCVKRFIGHLIYLKAFGKAEKGMIWEHKLCRKLRRLLKRYIISTTKFNYQTTILDWIFPQKSLFGFWMLFKVTPSHGNPNTIILLKFILIMFIKISKNLLWIENHLIIFERTIFL